MQTTTRLGGAHAGRRDRRPRTPWPPRCRPACARRSRKPSRRMLAAKGRVVVTGMGKSGHIARKVAATLASTGTPAFFLHPAEASHGDLGMIGARRRGAGLLPVRRDAGTARRDPLLQALRRAADRGRLGADSALVKAASLAFVLPAAEEACPNRLAPTTSTTMQLAFGDALAMALLEARGFSARDFHAIHPGGKLGAQLLTVARPDGRRRRGAQGGPSAPPSPRRSRPSPPTSGTAAWRSWTRPGRLVGALTDGDVRRSLGKARPYLAGRRLHDPHAGRRSSRACSPARRCG